MFNPISRAIEIQSSRRKRFAEFLIFGGLMVLSVGLGACAPGGGGNGKIKINKVEHDPLKKSVELCKDSLKAGQPLDAKNVKTLVCEADPEKDGSYKLFERPTQYSIFKADSGVQVALKALITFEPALSVEKTNEMLSLIDQICMEPIEQVFRREHVKLTLEWATAATVAGPSDLPTLDLDAAKDAKGEHYVMRILPKSSTLIPTSHAYCAELCAVEGGAKPAPAPAAPKVPKTLDDDEILTAGSADASAAAAADTVAERTRKRPSECLRKCSVEHSQPFCRNLAKVVGHWVGLADESESSPCQGEAAQLTKARGTDRSKSFMKGYSIDPKALEGSDTPFVAVKTEEIDRYWKEAKLYAGDRAKIMKGVCPNISKAAIDGITDSTDAKSAKLADAEADLKSNDRNTPKVPGS